MKKIYAILSVLLLIGSTAYGQTAQEKASIVDIVSQFTSTFGGRTETSRLEDYQIDEQQKEIRIYVNEIMAWYHFDRARVEQTYAMMRAALPKSRRDYRLRIYSN